MPPEIIVSEIKTAAWHEAASPWPVVEAEQHIF